MEPTKTCITPTKTWTVLQSLYVRPKKSYPYVYRHKIYLGVSITYLII
jgi:hypothetical protein